MTEKSYALILRNLSSDYYHNHIGFEEYRQQRRIILDQIDAEMNAHVSKADQPDEPDSSSIFMQTLSFFKNRDIGQ